MNDLGATRSRLTAGEKISRNNEIISMYRKGLSLREIGERFGVSFQRVQQILINLDEPRRTDAYAMRAKEWDEAVTGESTVEWLMLTMGVGRHTAIANARKRGVKLHGLREMRAARVQAPKEDIPHIRAMAKAGYGKKTARIIAQECGVTRNAIIGHWFRLRHEGLIE